MYINKMVTKRSVVLDEIVAEWVGVQGGPVVPIGVLIHMHPQLAVTCPGYQSLRRRRKGRTTETEGAEPRPKQGIAVGDRAAPFGRHRGQVQLTMVFPLVSHQPLKALVAIVNLRL